MSTTITRTKQALARTVRVTDEALTIDLEDGRTISAPVDWYPRLRHGSPAERSKWELIGEGQGIHWPDLDEDICVEGVLEGVRSQESSGSLQEWLRRRKVRKAR